MKLLLKILLVCVLAVVALHLVALAGVFAYSRMRSDTSQSAAAAGQVTVRIHVVKRGETLSAIAAGAHSTIEELAALNGLQNTNQISEGQNLKIPVKG